jgi:hypothetical protein
MKEGNEKEFDDQDNAATDEEWQEMEVSSSLKRTNPNTDGRTGKSAYAVDSILTNEAFILDSKKAKTTGAALLMMPSLGLYHLI